MQPSISRKCRGSWWRVPFRASLPQFTVSRDLDTYPWQGCPQDAVVYIWKPTSLITGFDIENSPVFLCCVKPTHTCHICWIPTCAKVLAVEEVTQIKGAEDSLWSTFCLIRFISDYWWLHNLGVNALLDAVLIVDAFKCPNASVPPEMTSDLSSRHGSRLRWSWPWSGIALRTRQS